jgi:signal transduction histidine kinase/CheY-like chemotaxis protein
MTAERSALSSRLSTAMMQFIDVHAATGVVITDAALTIESWNHWLVSALGTPAADAIGRPLFDVVPSLVERGLDQHYVNALKGEVAVLSHTLHHALFPAPSVDHAREPMLQSARIAPLYDGTDIVGTITVITDVSERVASEQALRSQIVKAEAARRTAETASRVKDEFLATLSHEIRTPLNAVLGWTRILLARDELDMATVRRAIEVIDRNASAQLTLISDMLDTARISAGKVRLDMGPVDLVAVVTAALDVVRPAADSKGVRLVTDFAPLPPVYGDVDRLQQVAWNLLSNAVKFTEKGGTVTVGLATHGEASRLTVADTGQGISPEFLPMVFERFTQGDPSSSRRHGGLGLGLSLVKDLVALHGGTVAVDSGGYGDGAIFTVLLPGRAAAVETPPQKGRTGKAASLASVRVLIVEDDLDALEIVTRVVTDVGASVIAATSTEDALAKLGETTQPPDIVITDIGMPHDDGYALLREIRALPAERGGLCPAIAVTAYATEEDRKRALTAGFDAHLAKPFAPQILVATLARILAASRA